MTTRYQVPPMHDMTAIEACEFCSAKFSLFKRKFHCFHCGHVLCRTCVGESQISMPQFYYQDPKPICTGCYPYFALTRMTENQLMEIHIKQLKDYLSLYNISSVGIVEKTDLVQLIKSTSLTEANQVHFRSKIKEFCKKSSSVENFLSDLFSIPFSGQSRSNAPQSNSQQNIPNVLPIFFQELFSAHPSASDNQYPGHASQSGYTRPSNPPSAPAPFRTQSFASSSSQSNAKPGTQSPQNVPTVPLIIKDNIDIRTLSSKTLKAILKKYNVDSSGILEKSELESRVSTLIHNMRLEALQANEDLICKICCEEPINCVLLECGHFVTCLDCAKRIQSSTNECPICRFRISRVVHTFRA